MAILATALAAVVIVALFTLTAIGGWAPFLHWTCHTEDAVAKLTNYYIPAVLVNSPYGGQAWGNGTFPATFPGIWNGPPPAGVTNVSYGTGALQGQALGALFSVNVSVYSLANVTEWGPGTSARCSYAFEAVLLSPGLYAEAGGGILGANNASDSSEPPYALIYEGTQSQVRSVLFDNAYGDANVAAISTCGGPSRSLTPILSSYLSVWFPVTVQGKNLTVPFVIPVAESYHYWFPANFGTWDVDNLSAPGGPGGGWAFSYVGPCA